MPDEYSLDASSFFLHIYQHSGDSLRDLALSGDLGRLRNRFISWRVFLSIFPDSSPVESWVPICSTLRSAYYSLQDSYKVTPTQQVNVSTLDPLIYNPLSQSSENPWNSFYMDNDLKQTIRNDIDRTLQERELFQDESIKELMVRVLFAWAKTNPEISYRQGMNELLAILLLVAVSEKYCGNYEIPAEAAEVLRELNDPTHTEPDVYWMFSKIMDLGVKELFLPVMAKKKKNRIVGEMMSFQAKQYENELVNKDKTGEADASVILKRSHRIHHRMLQALDKQLYTYMESQTIEPQISLQRWIRCILCREFNLSDTLTLWDSIFALANVNLENKIEFFTGKLDFCKELIMLDFICIAMIVFVRGFCKSYVVLQCDATGIMRRLLKFPPVEDVRALIRMALSYKERVLNGKGVIVPQLSHEVGEEDQQRVKSEGKASKMTVRTAVEKKEMCGKRIDEIISLLQHQLEQ